MIENGRASDTIADRVHRLARRLLRARDVAEVIGALETSLREDFGSSRWVTLVTDPTVPGLDGQSSPHLRLVPRASKNAIQGEHGDALKIRLCAPPVDGAANAALIEFLAETFDLPRARVQLLSGATSRNKRVLLAGCSSSSIRALLASSP